MGFYINPPTKTKEQWLDEHGIRLAKPPTGPTGPGRHFVALVDNGAFTAAAIAYDPGELAYFIDSPSKGDARPTVWYEVPDEDLIAVCPNVAKQLK